MAKIVFSALKLAILVVLLLSMSVPSLSSMRGSEFLASTASGQHQGSCAPLGQLCYPVGFPCCESLECKFDNSFPPAFKCAKMASTSKPQQGCAPNGQLCYPVFFPCCANSACKFNFSFPPAFKCAEVENTKAISDV